MADLDVLLQARSVPGRLRAKNNLVALIGHSGHDQAIGQLISGSQIRNSIFSTFAWPAWASMLSRGHYVFREDCKFAVSGTLVSDIRNTALTSTTNPYGNAIGKTQLQAAIDCPAATVAILTGHNDRINNGVLSANIADLTFIIQALAGAGKNILILSEWSSGSATFTTRRLSGTQLAYRNAWRRWIMDVAPTLAPGQIAVADTMRVTLDNASTTPGDVISGQTQDGVHPNTLGAFKMNEVVQPALQTLGIPYIAPDIHVAGEVYDATNNPAGNLLGALGTLADAGATWTQSASGGVTFSGIKPAAATPASIIFANGASQAGTLALTGSMVTTSTGRWWQINVQGSTAANAGPNLVFAPVTISLANLSAGDIIGMFGEWEIDAGGVGLAGLFRNMYRTIGSNVDNVSIGYNAFVNGGSLDAILAARTTPLAGTWNAECRQVISGTETAAINTNVTWQLAPSVSNVNFTVRLRNIADRKMPA